MPCFRWLLLFLLPLSFAQAQVSTFVPSESNLYDIVDRLEALGCTSSSQYRSFHPMDYADLQVVFEGAAEEESPQNEESEDGGENQTDENDPDAPRVRRSFPRCQAPDWLMMEKELLRRPVFANTVSVSPLVSSPDAVSLIGIEGAVTPLFPNRAARLTYPGGDLYNEIFINAQTGKSIGIGLSATAGWMGALENWVTPLGRFYLQEGYVKLGYRQLELTYGRLALRVGSSPHGSLLFSGATKPMDLIQFGVRPHRVGGILGFLGPMTLQSFLSWQGDTAFRTGSQFVGLLFGFKPLDFWEHTFVELFQFGGVGAPALTASDFFNMFLYSGSDDLALKRQRGFLWDQALWIPGYLFKLYSQVYFETLDTSSGGTLGDLVSFSAGVWFPKLGKADLRAEYVRTSPTAYENPSWKQGFTYAKTPLGHSLGPDAEGIYADLGLPPLLNWRPVLNFAYEARGKAVLIKPQATEVRYMGGLEIRRRFLRTDLSLQGRYGFVTNQNYVSGVQGSIGGFYGTLRYTFF